MPFTKGHVGFKSMLGKKHSEESKKKMKISHTGKKLSEEHKRKLGLKSLGHILSEESKKKIGDANRGKKCGSWKGDKATYRSIHAWIVNNWKEEKICELCGSNKHIDWHNKNRQYRRIRNDWQKLCRKCHMKIDGRTKYELG